MSYTEVIFTVTPPSPGSEILMAWLSEIGYESFEETGDGLKAYIKTENFIQDELAEMIGRLSSELKVRYDFSAIAPKNWNEVWESSYEPVAIRNDIFIRAPFHEEKPGYRFQLLIEPKMSFGTAHHETTHLMMELMLDEPVGRKKVLDMGCGTGILAILSEMLGAASVVAIDVEENACENAIENVRKNKCKKILVFQGDSAAIADQYDIILANINKNVLLKDMPVYTEHLTADGVLLLSGFYESDLDDIRQSTKKQGLSFDRSMVRNNWMAARFIKQ